MNSHNSNFIKVRCDECKNEQVIYGKASSQITCLVCQTVLATPKGGKTHVIARILEVLN